MDVPNSYQHHRYQQQQNVHHLKLPHLYHINHPPKAHETQKKEVQEALQKARKHFALDHYINPQDLNTIAKALEKTGFKNHPLIEKLTDINRQLSSTRSLPVGDQLDDVMRAVKNGLNLLAKIVFDGRKSVSDKTIQNHVNGLDSALAIISKNANSAYSSAYLPGTLDLSIPVGTPASRLNPPLYKGFSTPLGPTGKLTMGDPTPEPTIPAISGTREQPPLLKISFGFGH